MKVPKHEYEKRRDTYNERLTSLNKSINIIGNLRLLVFLAGTGTGIFIYMKGYGIPAIGVFAVMLVLFISLVIAYGKRMDEKRFTQCLLNINHNGIKRLENNWNTFKDNGGDFIDEKHSYTNDLDIFGESSLFQFINTAVTSPGRQGLKNMLSTIAPAKDDIIKRQEAVRELAGKLDWRQHFQAGGIFKKQKNRESIDLSQWNVNPRSFYLKTPIILIARILPFITISSIIIAFMPVDIPIFLILLPLAVQVTMLAVKFNELQSNMSMAGSLQNELKIYAEMLKYFETEQWESAFLNKLSGDLVNDTGDKAYMQIERLSQIVDRISIRYSQLYFVFNILTIWDYQCTISLERWKEKSGKSLNDWIRVLGEVEALASLSVIAHDHPDWVYPDIIEGKMALEADGIGHPLLPESRVCNDLKFDGRGSVLVITGSNMSGKSTLLRTVGINLVLAYAGAPVCASRFVCSIMEIYTSMRVRDDLNQRISSFYAELIRIKTIIEAVNKGKRVFFLLDEIFKGTNSKDRHTGAKVLVKKLSSSGSMGMVSTHDLELGDLAEENDDIHNYHFEESYHDGEIHFDYKLKEGVSTTRNAIYLMKMAGIDIE